MPTPNKLGQEEEEDFSILITVRRHIIIRQSGESRRLTADETPLRGDPRLVGDIMG